MSIDLGTLEKRLAAMEEAIAAIQCKLVMNAKEPHWIERVAGIVRNKEAFEEVMADVRATRRAEFPPEDAEDPAA